MWVPDVYQGAPTSVTLFIATVSNLGSFALIARLLSHGLAGLPPMWSADAAGGSGASLLLGNVVAIAQTNLKRMLAYSAIANAGFVLLGFSTGQAVGYQAALNFTIAYVLTTLAAFGLILVLSRSGFEHDEIADFRGLSTRDPMLAALMLVVMFSTAGVPPFVGFWAKLWIIQALLARRSYLGRDLRGADLGGRRVLLPARGLVHVFRAARAIGQCRKRGRRMRFILLLNTAAVTVIGLLPNALLDLCARLIR